MEEKEKNHKGLKALGFVGLLIVYIGLFALLLLLPRGCWPNFNSYYTITWKNYDGTVLEVDEHVQNGTLPTYDGSTPTKKDSDTETYTFSGWTPEVANASKDTTYTATFTASARSVTVSFNFSGHGSGTTLEVTSGGKIIKPADPEEEGYSFEGWYKDEACTTPWDFENDTVSSNTTIYAKWTANSYTVSFNMNGHGEAIDAQSIDYNGLVEEPTDPSASGYAFGGWFKEEGCTNAWNFASDKVTSDTTLYAKWNINSYTVTLHVNSGTINSGSIDSYTPGTGATLPTDVTRDHYSFEGWFDNSGLTGSAVTNISTTETGNKEYWAKWLGEPCTVSFDLNNSHTSETVASQSLRYGDLIAKPDDPETIIIIPPYAYDEFDYWYWEEEYEEHKWNFATDTVHGDMTLLAKWIKHK